MKYRNEKVGLNEVKNVAEHMMWQFKSANKSKTIENCIITDLMKHKMNDAIECTKEAKDELLESKKSLDNVVRKGTFVRNEFTDIAIREVNRIRMEGKEKYKYTVERAVHTDNNADKNQEVFNGVLIGDKVLEDYEKEAKGETNI